MGSGDLGPEGLGSGDLGPEGLGSGAWAQRTMDKEAWGLGSGGKEQGARTRGLGAREHWFWQPGSMGLRSRRSGSRRSGSRRGHRAKGFDLRGSGQIQGLWKGKRDLASQMSACPSPVLLQTLSH